jgi:hypothetical protein
MVDFVITFGPFKSVVNLSEPTLCSKQAWLDLAQAVREKKPFGLAFYQGNGEGSMVCDGEVLVCTAQPSGAGGDVMVKTYLPLNDQTHQALMEVIEHPLMHAAWARNFNS